MFTFDGADEKFDLRRPLAGSLGFDDDGAPCMPHSICRRFDLYRRFWKIAKNHLITNKNQRAVYDSLETKF